MSFKGLNTYLAAAGTSIAALVAGGTPAAPAAGEPPATPPAAPGTIVTNEQLEATVTAAYNDGLSEGAAAATAAANTRFSAVMNSDAGKANPAGAVFLLTETDMPAEKCIAGAANFKGAAPDAAPVAPGGVDAAAIAAATPATPLKTGQRAGQAGEQSEASAEYTSILDDVLTKQSAVLGAGGKK